MNTPLIQARGLKRYYRRGIETVKALDGVDLDIRDGEMVSILGPSGSGKTTLINLLSCLDVPTEGTLTIASKSVTGLSEDRLADVRRGTLGFIFQKFHLIPTLSVAENVELPLMFLRRPVDRDATRTALRQVGLENRERHLPKELSGGEMQRVAVARALIARPRILIADEPTGNLDKTNGDAIFQLFRKLCRDQGLTILITTHNLALGYEADRVITLEDGRILKEESGRARAEVAARAGGGGYPLKIQPSTMARARITPISIHQGRPRRPGGASGKTASRHWRHRTASRGMGRSQSGQGLVGMPSSSGGRRNGSTSPIVFRRSDSEPGGQLLQKRHVVGLQALREIGQVGFCGVLLQVVQAGRQQMAHRHGVVAFALISPGAELPQVADQILERLCLHESPFVLRMPLA